jgi:hypothetical protein
MGLDGSTVRETPARCCSACSERFVRIQIPHPYDDGLTLHTDEVPDEKGL